MLEISPLQPIDLNNKMVYIYELKNGGNFQYIYVKLEYVHKLGRLQSSLNIFKDCNVFNFCLPLYLLNAKAENPHGHRMAASSFQSYRHPHLIPANEMILSK